MIPVSLTRTFGLMVKDRRQGYAILAAMGVIWALLVTAVTTLELRHPGAAARLAGASMEGKETRFGVATSSLRPSFGRGSGCARTAARRRCRPASCCSGTGWWSRPAR